MKRKSVKTALLLVGAALFFYARLVEPRWIEVTTHHIQANIDRPLKVVQLSDLHTYEFGHREANVLDVIQRENPDAIVVPNVEPISTYQGMRSPS